MTTAFTTLQPVSGSTQAISISSTSSKSSAFGVVVSGGVVGSTTVRVFSSVDATIEIGEDPTATASSMPIAANMAEYIDIPTGYKIAGYTASSGTLYVTTMTKVNN